MNSFASKLDLSGLAQFKASDLLVDPSHVYGSGRVSAPIQVDLALIEFDPKQPRRTLVEATIAELAQSCTASRNPFPCARTRRAMADTLSTGANGECGQRALRG